MKVCIVATHSFPIPMPNLHTGDVVILDLAHGLSALGHDVTVCAPEGTAWDKLLPMRASYGKYPPSSEECEEEAFALHKDHFDVFDIVHDFSVSKRVAVRCDQRGIPTCSTLMGGPWRQQWPAKNLVVWSQSHRERVLRGATDFEGTSMPDMGGEPGTPVKDAHVVHGGIDTEFYCPSDYSKSDYFLWLGRWHPARGYKQAIELAKSTGIQLVLAGERPENELFANQANCAHEAEDLSSGCSNIRIEWLPKDPLHHKAKRELYRKAKALLYTVQFHEPFGLSQVEALACGTKVVVPMLGSCPEISSLVVDPSIPGGSWEDALGMFESSWGEWVTSPKQSAVSRQLAVERFDRKVMAANYVKQYHRMILERRR